MNMKVVHSSNLKLRRQTTLTVMLILLMIWATAICGAPPRLTTVI